MVAIKGQVARATGRDRHSKVHTAKGPKDRRVRLSALTAIQFYDVQDRLGYDRPSEAVDWLIHKAKASIEALPQRGSVNPGSVGVEIGFSEQNPLQNMENAAQTSCQENQDLQHFGFDPINDSLSSFSSSYVHMENSMEEFSSAFGSIRSAEYIMFQEESVLCLPPLNQPCFEPVALDLNDCQKVLSSNHKLSSGTGHQQQAFSSTWGESTFCLPAFPDAALSSRDSTKPFHPMQFPTNI